MIELRDVRDRAELAVGSRSDEERRLTFSRLTEQRLNRAYGMASALLRNQDEAQDAVHDAVVKAWSGWRSLRDQARFDAWFDRILVHCCMDRLRGDSAQRRAIALLAQEPRSTPAANTDQFAALRGSLEGLSAEHRVVVVLRFLEDMTVEDIARRVGVREGTVKSRLHYALRELRAAYDAADRM